MVYCGLYRSTADFEELREALPKLSINDPSFEFEPETSDALGFGFRCGFLGLLHMEIIQQRLEGEADLDLVQTAPNVTYEILTTTGETLYIHNPQKVPDAGQIEEFRQPIVKVNFVLPAESHRPRHAALRGPPRQSTSAPSICHRRAPCSSTTCRWPK